MTMRVKPSKYRAKRTEVDGITFASQKEARRYQELKLLERAGEIGGLELQPKYPLVVVGGDLKDYRHEIGAYVGDFRYFDGRKKKLIVEDVKGFKTPLYRWKKKHVEAQYGIQIVEV